MQCGTDGRCAKRSYEWNSKYKFFRSISRFIKKMNFLAISCYQQSCKNSPCDSSTINCLGWCYTSTNAQGYPIIKGCDVNVYGTNKTYTNDQKTDMYCNVNYCNGNDINTGTTATTRRGSGASLSKSFHLLFLLVFISFISYFFVRQN